MSEDRQPFEPIGAVARWTICYDVLRAHEIGDVVPYREFMDALDPEITRQKVQAAVRQAADTLLEMDCRAIEAVPNKGYRIVEPKDHLRLARRDQKASHLKLHRGKALVEHVDLDLVEDGEVRKAFGLMARAFTMQMAFNRQLDVRQRQLAEALGAVEERSERTAAEVAELRRRMARLEGEEEEAVA